MKRFFKNHIGEHIMMIDNVIKETVYINDERDEIGYGKHNDNFEMDMQSVYDRYNESTEEAHQAAKAAFLEKYLQQ